jgi:hypothetical protein
LAHFSRICDEYLQVGKPPGCRDNPKSAGVGLTTIIGGPSGNRIAAARRTQPPAQSISSVPSLGPVQDQEIFPEWFCPH